MAISSHVVIQPNGNHIAIPIITVCVVFSTIFYAIRFYAKYLGKKVNVADYITVVAFPLFWIYVYYSYRLSWSAGYLVHLADIPLQNIEGFSYVTWLATLLYLWLIALVKIAILLEWVDIFVPRGKRGFFSWTCYTTCFAIACLSGILFIMDLVNCTPFQGNYNPLIPGLTCKFKIPQFALASATTNLALDLIPLVLAQKVIWSLNMNWQRKAGVSVVFLIAIIGCIASVVRLYYATRFFTSTDQTYWFSIMALCSMVEVTCAQLILCVPFTPKALNALKQTRTFSRLQSYMSSRNRSTYANNSDAFYDSHDTPKPTKKKENWFSTRGSSNDTVYSLDSDRPLQQPTQIHVVSNIHQK